MAENLSTQARQNQIHNKGFDMSKGGEEYLRGNPPIDYRKIKVGVKNLEDAVLNLGSLQSKNLPGRINKGEVLRAIAMNDLDRMREISNFFYDMDGIYQKVCNYIAYLYRYDWYLAAEVYDENPNTKKLLKEYASILNYLDKSYVKKVCGDIALKVVKDGAYYGYIVDSKDNIVIQELPVKYCRCIYNVAGNVPAIEFNMKFFDKFTNINYRMKILKLFPEEFEKGYILYKQGKLPSDNPFTDGHYGSWYLLEPGNAFKFSLNNREMPLFINAIPKLMDLDAAQDLDRRKQMQQLLKIIVQQLPLDKNGDLIFDVDEAHDIHENAIEMLSRAIGVDILTTFTEVKSIDISDKNATEASSNYADKAKNSAFDAFGVTTNVFNTSGNLSVEKSVLADESSLRNLLYQFQIMFDQIIQKKSSKNSTHWQFRFYMLETTQFNYRELSKLYKEQTQIGFSKLLPQIALGQSQSFILNSITFENEILNLSSIMIPPLMSSTLNGADVLGKSGQEKNSTSQNNIEKKSTSDSGTGRPEKAEGEKSDKTLKNLESQQ